MPFELVKIRLQDRNSAGKYKGPLDCVAQIIRNEGILGMYNGMEATFWRYVSRNSRPANTADETNRGDLHLLDMSCGTAVTSPAFSACELHCRRLRSALFPCMTILLRLKPSFFRYQVQGSRVAEQLDLVSFPFEGTPFQRYHL